MNYDQAERSLMDIPKAAMESYSNRVTRQIAETESRLADLKRMQEIFAKHPEFEELLTLVQRGRV